MKQTFSWMKYIVCTLILLGSVVTTQAQENPKYVCDTDANRTIDLGIDVMGMVLTRDGGYWDQVNPADTSIVIAHDVDNIFVLTGKPVGEYAFKYIATNNVCLPQGSEVPLARIIILETAKDFSHVVYSCTGENLVLDLATIVPPGLAGTTFSNTSAGSLTGSVLTIGDYTGTLTVSYRMDYVGGKCNDDATITIEVIRDDANPSLTIESLTYCQETAPQSINLSNLSGMTAYDNARWILSASSTATDVTLVGNVATFGATPPAAGVYTFSYAWDGTATGCYPAGSADFIVTISAAGLTLPTNPTDAICKTDNPNRVYNLTLEGLGMSLPLSAGRWEQVSVPEGQYLEIDVADGLFELADVVATGNFVYKFIAAEVADICGLTGETTLTLTVGDVGGSSSYDGRVQLCALDLASKPGSFTLSDYIMGIPAGVTWTGPAGVTITGDQVLYSDLANLGNGTHKFVFTYNSAGCSGTGEGALYVTITNDLDLSENISLSFCRPDMPKEINMNQVIGADLEGTWAITVNDIDKPASLTDGIFSETAVVGDGAKVYELVFTPTPGASECTVPGTITVTIKVDDDKF